MTGAKLTYIDLFAGASGLSEGFVNAGLNPLTHVEMNSEACRTIQTRMSYHYLKSKGNLSPYWDYVRGKISVEKFYREIPNSLLESVLNVEIGDNTIHQIFSQIKKQRRPIDLIIGGPPCQAYSLVGRCRNGMEDDPRTKLYIQYGRFLKEFSPKAFVFENVPGLLSAKKGEHFRNLKTYFKKLGYNIYYNILDASDYGVLQYRKRIIIVGWREKYDQGYPDFDKKKKDGTVFQLFADLPELLPGQGTDISNYKKSGELLSKMLGIRNNVDFISQHITRPHNQRDLSIYKIAIEKWEKEGERLRYPDLPEALKTHQNQTSFIDRYKVVDGSSISHTIVAHIAKDGHYYIHPDENQCRSISVREAARLQSFPDDFYFEGSRSAAFKQIGNAVPPSMAYAIATKMKEML